MNLLKKAVCFFFLLALYATLDAQRDVDEPYPQLSSANPQFKIHNTQFTTPPLHLPISLAGCFAEIRPNHFHSGIDIRTEGKEGYQVYAPDDGYVSRINISAWGGGKVLYIDHPGGYRTVYMHLSAFCGDIGRFVHDYQYGHRTFAMDITLPKDSILVKKGQVVALTGNTGGSSGPHLHYEIRLAENDQTINPLYFGLPYSDPVTPTIAGIKLYPAGEQTTINGKNDELKIYPFPVAKKGKKAMSHHNEALVIAGPFYCGIYAYDQHETGARNKNGIEKIELFVDGELFYRYTVPTFLFEETRAINAIIDYPQYQRNREYYIITRQLRGNRNNWSIAYKGNGYLEFADGERHHLEYVVYDIKGNSRRHTFTVTGAQRDTSRASHIDYIIPSGTPIAYFKRCRFSQPGFNATLEPYTVYENDELVYSTAKDAAGLSPLHRLSLRNHPLPPHQSFTVRLDVPEGVPEKLLDRLTIVCINGKTTAACPTKRTGNTLTATTRNFGGFAVRLDTIAPTISPVSFNDQKALKGGVLTVKIGDNLSGIATYSCTVNGVWQLAEHDGKTATLNVDASCLQKGNNEVIFTVTDAVGNCCVGRYTIKR